MHEYRTRRQKAVFSTLIVLVFLASAALNANAQSAGAQSAQPPDGAGVQPAQSASSAQPVQSPQARDGARDAFTISNSYRNVLSNEHGTGMLDRIFTEVFDRLGFEAELVFTPTERSLVDVNAGILDAEANRTAGMEQAYPNLRRVPEPNMVMEFVAFSSRPIEIDGWESLRGLDIGIVRGWKIFEDALAGFPHVVTVPTERELFTMLERGRIDVALYSKMVGYGVLRDFGIEGISHLSPPLAVREMYLYVNARHEDLAEPIARALRSIKEDGTYTAIVDEVLEAYGIPGGAR